MWDLIAVAHTMAVAQMEEDRRFHERCMAATPEERKSMIEKRDIERRHREQIAAQKEIADAIRYAARPGRYFFDF